MIDCDGCHDRSSMVNGPAPGSEAGRWGGDVVGGGRASAACLNSGHLFLLQTNFTACILFLNFNWTLGFILQNVGLTWNCRPKPF